MTKSATAPRTNGDCSVGVVAHSAKLSPEQAADLRSALHGAGMRTTWVSIDKGRAATKAARRLVRDGATHIVACGGDGTVRATAGALIGSEVPLSVLPAGTANQFSAALHLPDTCEAIVDALAHGWNRRLDVGRCNGEPFVIMAGTGLDAALINGAEDGKTRFGRIAYLSAGVKAVRTAERFPVRVKADGEQLFKGEATCVLVANIGRVMGGFDAVPGARPDDGRLDVAVVTAEGAAQWGSLVWHAVRGAHTANGLMHLGSGSHITVRLDRKRRMEMDGGVRGKTDRLDVKAVPGGLLVRVPSPS